jgi:N-ethylmaleimide reductase
VNNEALAEEDTASTTDPIASFRIGAPLNAPDYASLYAGGAQGYTDYPMLTATLSSKR